MCSHKYKLESDQVNGRMGAHEQNQVQKLFYGFFVVEKLKIVHLLAAFVAF